MFELARTHCAVRLHTHLYATIKNSFLDFKILHLQTCPGLCNCVECVVCLTWYRLGWNASQNTTMYSASKAHLARSMYQYGVVWQGTSKDIPRTPGGGFGKVNNGVTVLKREVCASLTSFLSSLAQEENFVWFHTQTMASILEQILRVSQPFASGSPTFLPRPNKYRCSQLGHLGDSELCVQWSQVTQPVSLSPSAACYYPSCFRNQNLCRIVLFYLFWTLLTSNFKQFVGCPDSEAS